MRDVWIKTVNSGIISRDIDFKSKYWPQKIGIKKKIKFQKMI